MNAPDLPGTRRPGAALRVAGSIVVGVLVAGLFRAGLNAQWLYAVIGGAMAAGAAWTLARRRPSTAQVDPFALGEPWRNIVRQAQTAQRRFAETISTVRDGPLRDRLVEIGEEMNRGLADAWQVAVTGNQIDETVRRLDPARLESNLAISGDEERPSIQYQLDTVRRLQQQSAETARRLKVTQAQFDELVAQASEVAVGALPADAYSSDVNALNQDLRALRAATEELGPA